MNTEPVQQEPAPVVVAVPQTNPNSIIKVQLANLFAAILAVCFFFPWFRLLFIDVSGFLFQKEPGWAKIVWAMPVFAAITVITGLAGKNQQIPGQIAGATPFAFLAYAISKHGMEFVQILTPAAWLALGCGAALFIFSAFPESNPSYVWLPKTKS